jgi:acetoacetate decarboxylase
VGAVRYAARSAEQLRNREVQATSVGAWASSLMALYETDPEVVAAVLPPPLEPTDQPLVRVTVARVDLGRDLPPFGAGTFAVQARHGDVVGNYPLVMPMTTEQSVIGGRETFGEPKKLADVRLEQDGDRVTGTVSRLGVTFVELTGTVAEARPLPADDGSERVDFYFKFLPAPDGRGFDADPSLVYCRRRESFRSLAGVDGQVVLRESRFDPVADLPVLRLVDMTLSERRSVQRGEIVQQVPGEVLMPYVHQRYDDLSPVGED